jgi:hypothetical protein
MTSIIHEMSVPLIQGALRYVYLVGSGGRSKQKAEGWAFTAAILPQIHACDANAAATIKAAMIYTSSEVPDIALLFKTFRSVYECMGVTCADIGEYLDVTPATALCADDLAEIAAEKNGVAGATTSLQVSSGSGVAVALLSAFAAIAA